MSTTAEQKRKVREKKRAQGYILKQLWVKPEYWLEVKKLADKLKREEANEKTTDSTKNKTGKDSDFC